MQKTTGLWHWPLVSAKRYILQVLTSGPWNIAWQINIHFQSFHKQLAAILIVLWCKPEFFCVFPPSPSFLLLTYLQALGLCCFGQQICQDPKASQGTEKNLNYLQNDSVTLPLTSPSPSSCTWTSLYILTFCLFFQTGSDMSVTKPNGLSHSSQAFRPLWPP